MRSFRLVWVAAVVLLATSSCKKDKEEEKQETGGQLEYDGGKYTIEKGLIWDYEDHYFGSHYTQSYFLKDGREFASWGTQELGPNDPPITLFYVLSSPGTSRFQNGVFKCYYNTDYAQWQINGLPDNMKTEFLCTSGYVCFDGNNDKKITENEIFRVFGGTLSQSDSFTEYNLELENGKKVTGRNAATFTKTQPPA